MKGKKHIAPIDFVEYLKNVSELYLEPTIMFIIFWDILMVEQIFLSPQVKRRVIISSKLVYTSYLTSCRAT